MEWERKFKTRQERKKSLENKRKKEAQYHIVGITPK